MQTKKEKIIIIVCLAITVVVLGLVIFAAVRSNRKTPEIPTDTIIEDVTNTPDIPAIEPSEGEKSGKSERPGEVVIDVVKENEKHEKPNEPTIEGDPFIGDGYKEASDEE